MIENSGEIWFEESGWIDREFEFPNCEVTRWKITGKICEKEEFWADHYSSGDNPVFSNSSAVFVCCDPKNTTQEAILKVRMQIPKWLTWSESPILRAQQASPALSRTANKEIRALKLLMEANCSCTPKLIASTHQIQGESDRVPGGYMDFILMERVPGKVPGGGGFLESCLPTDEWMEIKSAFKTAWLECIACGMYHMDRGSRNLIWDRERQKCYIVDWEKWLPNDAMSPQNLTWSDSVYLSWHITNRR